jgi:3-oxoacyl-[acyl-carrier protein] reductase
MSSDQSIAVLSEKLEHLELTRDGATLILPQPHAANDPLPDSEVWRSPFQTSFILPRATLKAAMSRMKPDVHSGQRAKIVIISGISSARVQGHYATSNVIRTAWLGEAKTLAFALGTRNIHINTLSLGGTLTPATASLLPDGQQQQGRVLKIGRMPKLTTCHFASMVSRPKLPLL